MVGVHQAFRLLTARFSDWFVRRRGGKGPHTRFLRFFCGGGVIRQDFAEGSEGELDLDWFGVSHRRRSYKSPGEPQEG